MGFSIRSIDHVQMTAPKGSENEAREFFGNLLGLKEVNKPNSLQKRGGVWFEFGDMQLHIGIEEPFNPSKKAHPGFLVECLKNLKEHLVANQIDFVEDDNIAGVNRIFLYDPFGNRIELLEKD